MAKLHTARTEVAAATLYSDGSYSKSWIIKRSKWRKRSYSGNRLEIGHIDDAAAARNSKPRWSTSPEVLSTGVATVRDDHEWFANGPISVYEPRSP